MSITSVGGTDPTQAAQSTQTDNSPASIGYDAFIQLLLAQLKNQDPMKPLDSNEYVAQLASLSNLEQGIKQNEKLDQIFAASSIAQINTIIGRTVTSADGTLSGQVTSARLTTDGIVATLASGDEMLIGAGVTVAAS
jgi:flagellar basal-body rod modification protein FlgD